MGTWIKETDNAIYLMEGGFYIDKISKVLSAKGNGDKTVSLAAMKNWFARSDAPGAMTVCAPGSGSEPSPKPPNYGTDTASAPPTGTQTINDKGLQIVKTFEGLALEAYLDAVGIWTIGYGTTAGVKSGMKITIDQAEAFLKRDLHTFEKAVTEDVTVSLTSDQFSALVSFVYNVGPGSFADSTLLRLLNQGDTQGAADQFLRWDKGSDGPLPGLTRRRKAERALFLGQDFTPFLTA